MGELELAASHHRSIHDYIFALITEILISWLRGDNGKGVGEWARRLPTPFTTASGSEKRECRGCLGNGSMFVVRRSQRRCGIRRCVCLSVGSGSSLRRCSCLLACLHTKLLLWRESNHGVGYLRGRVLEIWMTGKKAVSIS